MKSTELKEEIKTISAVLIPDGCYRFGKSTEYCTKFSVYKKPHFIHRFFMKVILGLYWEDNLNKK